MSHFKALNASTEQTRDMIAQAVLDRVNHDNALSYAICPLDKQQFILTINWKERSTDYVVKFVYTQHGLYDVHYKKVVE